MCSRDQSSICVVEDVRDIIAMEKTHEFKGVYHVLHGSISPMNGIGPDDIKIKESPVLHFSLRISVQTPLTFYQEAYASSFHRY